MLFFSKMQLTSQVNRQGKQMVVVSTSCTNLSVSSSGNKSVKIRLVATRHLQTFYNLLRTCGKPVDNKF